MDISHMPYDLKGYAKERLSKVSVTDLVSLCQERGLEASPSDPPLALVQRLLKWKEDYDKQPAPPRPQPSKPEAKARAEAKSSRKASPPPKGEGDKSLPYDLDYVGEAKLLKLELADLVGLLEQRGIPIPSPATKEELVRALLSWKKKTYQAQAQDKGGKQAGGVRRESGGSTATEGGSVDTRVGGRGRKQSNSDGPSATSDGSGDAGRAGRATRPPPSLHEMTLATPSAITPIQQGARPSFSGLVLVTHNIKDFSVNNPHLETRIENLKRCYKVFKMISCVFIYSLCRLLPVQGME